MKLKIGLLLVGLVGLAGCEINAPELLDLLKSYGGDTGQVEDRPDPDEKPIDDKEEPHAKDEGKSCLDMIDCVLDCDYDTGCETECVEEGTANAQEAFYALLDCYGDGDGDCSRAETACINDEAGATDGWDDGDWDDSDWDDSDWGDEDSF